MAVVVHFLCGAGRGNAEPGFSEVHGAAVVAVVGAVVLVVVAVLVDGALRAAAAAGVRALAQVVRGVAQAGGGNPGFGEVPGAVGVLALRRGAVARLRAVSPVLVGPAAGGAGLEHMLAARRPEREPVSAPAVPRPVVQIVLLRVRAVVLLVATVADAPGANIVCTVQAGEVQLALVLVAAVGRGDHVFAGDLLAVHRDVAVLADDEGRGAGARGKDLDGGCGAAGGADDGLATAVGVVSLPPHGRRNEHVVFKDYGHIYLFSIYCLVWFGDGGNDRRSRGMSR